MSTHIIHERLPAEQSNLFAELYWAIRCDIAFGFWRISDAFAVWAARMAGVGPRGG